MEILNSLNQKIKEAMINKNASELKTLRLIKSEITRLLARKPTNFSRGMNCLKKIFFNY